MKLPPGTILKQQYQVESCLGEGGFGITYKCKDIKTHRYFAIKEIWPEGGSREGTKVTWGNTTPQEQTKQIHKFQTEAYFVSKCIHPHVVRVYEWFEENNTAYMVMGFVPSTLLMDILVKKVEQENQPLSQARVIKYFRQIAGALQIIHAQNLLHRDIKPQNILIDEVNDRAILIDFGATREFAAGKTQRHTVILTPGFAPVEQYIKVFQRGSGIDIYALCACMYVLLTANIPPEAMERYALLNQHGQDSLVPIRQFNPHVNPYLEKIIHIGLNIAPEHRFQDAGEIIKLLNLLDGHSQARLIFQKAGYSITEFILDGTHAILGKSEGNQRQIKVDLDGFPDSNTISRNHAVIYKEKDDWKIKDLNSLNGIFIKPFGSHRYGGRITDIHVLNCGDEIAFGKVKFLFQTF